MTPAQHRMDERIRRIWAAKSIGDHISTEDMLYFVNEVTNTRDMLLSLGPEFNIAWRPISDVINEFNTYLLARARQCGACGYDGVWTTTHNPDAHAAMRGS